MQPHGDAAGAIRILLERIPAAGLAPGAVAAWSVGEDAGLVAVGQASLRPLPTVVRRETVYDLASLTKPLATATLLLLARREGRLDLDWPVRRLLPEAAGRPVGELRVAELATHTAGLPAWRPLYADGEAQGAGPVATLVRSVPEPAVRGRVVYSCLGYLLLGLMLERCFEQDLESLFRERVAGPCGCREQLGFRPPSSAPIAGGALQPGAEHELVLAAGGDPATIPASGPGLPDDGNARWLGGTAGNSGLFGSAAAVLALARHWLPGTNDGLLSPEEIRLATLDRTPGREQARGLGWQLAATPGCSAGTALAPTAFGHTGFTGTSLWLDPTRRAVMVLLANRHHPAHRGVDLHPLRRRFHHLVLG